MILAFLFLGERTPIVTGQNIGDFKSEGHYYWLNGFPSGRPSQTDNCVMDVMCEGRDFIVQVLYCYSPLKIMMRWWNNSNEFWDSWKTFYPASE